MKDDWAIFVFADCGRQVEDAIALRITRETDIFRVMCLSYLNRQGWGEVAAQCKLIVADIFEPETLSNEDFRSFMDRNRSKLVIIARRDLSPALQNTFIGCSLVCDHASLIVEVKKRFNM